MVFNLRFMEFRARLLEGSSRAALGICKALRKVNELRQFT